MLLLLQARGAPVQPVVVVGTIFIWWFFDWIPLGRTTARRLQIFQKERTAGCCIYYSFDTLYDPQNSHGEDTSTHIEEYTHTTVSMGTFSTGLWSHIGNLISSTFYSHYCFSILGTMWRNAAVD